MMDARAPARYTLSWTVAASHFDAAGSPTAYMSHGGYARAMLTAHAAWFGALLCGVVSFVHWLVLRAHRSDPPHLANQLALGGIVLFVAASGIWVAAVMFMFRLPAVVDSRGFRQGVRSVKEEKTGRHPS